MKKIILYFLLLFISYSIYAQEEGLFTSEEFVFKTKDGLQLKGTIILPEKFGPDDKISILLTPPQKNSRDYGGMLSSLAKSLSSKGIATLHFDNRAFTDTIASDEAYQVADVHAAFETIIDFYIYHVASITRILLVPFCVLRGFSR